MSKSIYAELNSILVWSDYYRGLSGKRDIYSGRMRIITVNDLIGLSTKYAEEHGLNKELVKLIINTRELGFYPYGEIGYEFLKEKYKDFSQEECSIAILKDMIEEYNKSYSYDILIPEEVTLGVHCSFNKENTPSNKEGVMIYMIAEGYGTSRLRVSRVIDEKQKNEYIQDLNYVWDKYMSDCEITNENIAKNILKYSEAELKEMGSFYEE